MPTQSLTSNDVDGLRDGDARPVSDGRAVNQAAVGEHDGARARSKADRLEDLGGRVDVDNHAVRAAQRLVQSALERAAREPREHAAHCKRTSKHK